MGHDGFVALQPRQPRRSKAPGCLVFLGGPLAALGLWLIALAVLIRPDPDTAHLQIAAGAVLAVVGLSIIIIRMRRTVDSAAPQAELAVAENQVVTPGAEVTLRVTQPGPATLSRLAVILVCERRYSTEVAVPDSASISTVESTDAVETLTLLDEKDVAVARRGSVTRTVTMAIPRLARPSGPTLPSGVIAWHLDVTTMSRGGSVVHDVFDVNVALPGSAAVEVQVRPERDKARSDLSAAQLVGAGVGCVVIPLGFLLVGPLFLYLYFSGATTRRGNPVMGLVAGVLFSALGLLGLWIVITGRRRQARGSRHRLPK